MKKRPRIKEIPQWVVQKEMNAKIDAEKRRSIKNKNKGSGVYTRANGQATGNPTLLPDPVNILAEIYFKNGDYFEFPCWKISWHYPDHEVYIHANSISALNNGLKGEIEQLVFRYYQRDEEEKKSLSCIYGRSLGIRLLTSVERPSGFGFEDKTVLGLRYTFQFSDVRLVPDEKDKKELHPLHQRVIDRRLLYDA